MTATKPRRSTPKERTRDPATRYAEQVLAGKVVTGKLVRLACERHIRDLTDGHKRGLVWNPAAVTRVVNYFRDVLRLNGGKHEGEPFILRPFQCFVTGSVFGWQRAATGMRRFRTAYVEGGKGMGKSPWAAGIGMYMLTSDDEPRAEVYSGASKQDQAMILFRDAVAMVDQSPALKKRILKSGVAPVWNLAFPEANSFFRPLASDKAQSGTRPHCGLLDELHEHENDIMVSMMRAGMKGRRQPLIFEITNSGWDRESVCWRHHEYSQKILEGSLEDDEWFAYVCGLDPCEKHANQGQPEDGCPDCDDWRDEDVWEKANPNLGVTIDKEYLQRQVREAEGMPAQQSLIKRLNFCIWTQGADLWLDAGVWAMGDVPLRPLAGRSCFGGLDLSKSIDLTAMVRVFPDTDGTFDWVWRFWMPRDTYLKRAFEDRAPYDQWVREGWIELTSGNGTDYSVVHARILEDAAENPFRKLAFDPWNANEITTGLVGDGIEAVAVKQHYQLLSPAMKAVERYLREGKIRHGGNPVARWMCSNTAVLMDTLENIKPAKDRSAGRIDGISALMTAYALVVLAPPEPDPPSVWVMG